MTKHTREELLYLAKLAEQCERYDGKSVNDLRKDQSLRDFKERDSLIKLQLLTER